jgi:GntR family transcriptional regulator/MocR family aminotransferase
MLTYSFENIGSESLYEHLYKCIRTDILSGSLQPDYKLPSKRTFSKNLGVSTITVENAYAQLMAEGYIYSLPKKGYYVSDIATFSPAVKKTATMPEKNFSKNSQPAPEKMDFSTNHTSAENFPFYTWAKLMKDVMADSGKQLLVPSPAAGIYKLRQAIAQHLYDFRGMNVSPEQIIVGAGTEYLYSLLIQLLGRDKTFAVEDPGYSKIRLIYESNNVRCMCVPLDNDGIKISALNECNADILHLSPSHHYPTGIVTPISRRYELLGWASKSDSRYIIEDDYDSEFRLLGKPIPSLQSIDVLDKVIYMNTFTKSLTPTIRISYMVLPMPLMEKFNRQLNFYSCTVSNFEQFTLARFINEGHFEKHINRMRIFYRNQRDLLIDTIKKSPVSKHVTIQEKDAGLHFLMQIKTDMTDSELIKKAEEAGLKVTCLSQYYYNASIAVNHTLVINYSALEPEMIPTAVKMLTEILV